MTWLSVFNSFMVFFLLMGGMLWNLVSLLVFLILSVFSILFLWLETANKIKLHYLKSFWLFMLSEMLVFLSLMVSCLWFQEDSSINLSPYLEMPFFGCFLLMGSSMTMTAFHHTVFYFSGNMHLGLTLMLGIGFMLLQLMEFEECNVKLMTSVYHASCFCTVGLHFTHVLMGILLLLSMFVWGVKTWSEYYSTLMVWYWHFVDYIWLLVYTVVYLCF